MSSFSRNTAAPYDRAAAVVPTDGARFAQSGIWVGGAGNVTGRDGGGNVIVFTGVPAGTFLPVLFTEVSSTGTTATNMVRCF